MLSSRVLIPWASFLLAPTLGLLPNLVFPSTLAAFSASFDWSNVTSSPDLHYQRCYDDFECARLTLPLDWHDRTTPYHVSIAVIRLPARVPESDSTHGGTVILNPGGPGGSGVLWALQVARQAQRLLDGPRHYEILSFDPRGIFRSTPNAYCFDSAVESEIWLTEKRAAGSLDAAEYALTYNWAAEEARGKLCASTPNGRFNASENVRQHLSTAYVARDMLEILNKIDERKAWSSAAVTSHQQRAQQQQQQQQQQDATSQRPLRHSDAMRPGQLQYIGTSYGTFLGQTFASMYPERVGRMVLDANVDGDNWVSVHEASIDDHAAAREHFFERCFASNVSCAFWRDTDAGPGDVAARLDALLAALDAAPFPITGHGHASPVTKADVLQGFFTTAYQPLMFFAPFAAFLNAIATNSREPHQPFWQRPIPTRDSFSDPLLANKYQGFETSPAVHCADGPDLSAALLPGFRAHLANLTRTYGWAGAVQADFKIPCWSWPPAIRTKWRYAGPFGYPDATSRASRPPAPILFVNNRIDPVCPLRNAKKLAKAFRGSVALEQDTVGHGALWPAGECMWGYVKRYLDNGVLPAEGTVCAPPCRAFEDCAEGTSDLHNGFWWR